MGSSGATIASISADYQSEDAMPSPVKSRRKLVPPGHLIWNARTSRQPVLIIRTAIRPERLALSPFTLVDLATARGWTALGTGWPVSLAEGASSFGLLAGRR